MRAQTHTRKRAGARMHARRVRTLTQACTRVCTRGLRVRTHALGACMFARTCTRARTRIHARASTQAQARKHVNKRARTCAARMHAYAGMRARAYLCVCTQRYTRAFARVHTRTHTHMHDARACGDRACVHARVRARACAHEYRRGLRYGRYRYAALRTD